MLYVEHNDYKNKQLAAQRKYDEILAGKEKLFAKTQPKATTYDAENSKGVCLYSFWVKFKIWAIVGARMGV